MSELKWIDSYNCHTARLPYGLTLTVNWDSIRTKAEAARESGYRVSACGVTLKALAPDLVTGKSLALSLARKVLSEVLASLPEEPCTPHSTGTR